ncbi:MAG: hypothetical protein ABGZ53_18255 [Fuerstiella sp.]
MTKPRSPTDWVNHIDADDIAAAYGEATTDAYGDDEQHTGLLTVIGDQLQFPFKGRVLGQIVNIVAMEWPDVDEYGLDLIAELDAQQHRIALQSVNVQEPFPKGVEYLAAYLDWRRRF